MKTSGIWNFRYTVGRIMMGLVFAAMICGMDAVPALAKKDRGYHEYVDGERVYRPHDYKKRMEKHQGYYETVNGRRVYRAYGYKARMEKHNRGYYETVNGRRIYRTYGYRERVDVRPPVYYAPPPPVYYAPPPPSGVRIFFPPVYLH